MAIHDTATSQISKQIPPQSVPAKRKRRRVRSQRGSIIRRGKSFIAVFRGPEGRQLWRTFHSRSEATACLNDSLNLLKEGKFVDARAELFSDVADKWLVTLLQRSRRTIKPSTWRTYRSLFKNWLTPEFGTMDVCDITRVHVRNFADRLLDSKLKAATIRMILILLNDFFEQAVDNQLAVSNPTRRLDVVLPDDAKKTRMPSRKDVEATWAKLDPHPIVQGVLGVGAMTGMRLGELLALFWSEVDWLEGQIHVTHSLTHANQKNCEGKFENISWVRSTALARVPPKTKNSRRDIDMPAELAAKLRVLRAELPNPASPYVFQAADGGPISPESIREVFHAAQEAAGVARFNPHSLRHFYNSNLLDAGASSVQVREQMGHASITETNRYTHGVSAVRPHTQKLVRALNFPVGRQIGGSL
jgi:integrase